MSITSSMYSAISGLNMSLAAMKVASDNIANVNTPGYSRQRLNLATSPTWQGGAYGQMGTGVSAQNITRIHDEFLSRSIVTKSSEYGGMYAKKTTGEALEAFFNESDGKGINEAMSDFFSLWDTVAASPELGPSRESLASVAQTLAEQLTVRRNDMDSVRQDLNNKVVSSVNDINGIINTIAGLNQSIMLAENPDRNQEANVYRDTRDAALIQLGELIDINYREDSTTGAINITFKNGPPLLLNTSVYEVGTVTDESGDIHVIANNRRTEPPWPEDVTSEITGGAVGGWINYRDTEMREFYLQYESFVDNLTFQINKQHSQGVGVDNYTSITSSSLVSSHPATKFSFPGEDNDLKITALVPHLDHQEPYTDIEDPENIAVRFVKSDKPSNEVTSNVVWNDDPSVRKWEVTVTLPTDSNGNVTATSEDVIRHINDEKTMGANRGSSPSLPPVGVVWPYKAGDFINIQSGVGDDWDGPISFSGSSYPNGADHFQSLDRSLANTTGQGHHLSHGTENAMLTTPLKGDDNDLIFTATESGAQGERVAVEYMKGESDPQPLGVQVYTDINGTQRISVTLETNEKGVILTSAGDIKDLINNHSDTRDLVRAEHPEGQQGVGKVKEMDALHLDRSGYFELVTYNELKEPTFNRITVDPDDTLRDIAERIGTTMDSGITGVRAEIITDQNGKDSLRIVSDTENGYEYAFRDDTSGALAVLGINNLLTGDSSAKLAVNQAILDNPSLLAAGRLTLDGTVAPGNNENALEMAKLKDERFEFSRLPEGTLGTAFNTFYANIGSSNRSIETKHDFIYGTLNEMYNQQDTVSGVNLDEELSDILRFQYMYQASAKIISTIDEMMSSLMALR